MCRTTLSIPSTRGKHGNRFLSTGRVTNLERYHGLNSGNNMCACFVATFQYDTGSPTFAMCLQMWPHPLRSEASRTEHHRCSRSLLLLPSSTRCFFTNTGKNFWYSSVHVFLGSSQRLFGQSWRDFHEPVSILAGVRNSAPSSVLRGNSCSKTSFHTPHEDFQRERCWTKRA